MSLGDGTRAAAVNVRHSKPAAVRRRAALSDGSATFLERAQDPSITPFRAALRAYTPLQAPQFSRSFASLPTGLGLSIECLRDGC